MCLWPNYARIDRVLAAIWRGCSPIHQGLTPIIRKNDGKKTLSKNLLKQKTRLFMGGFFHAVGFG
jgi:hypothetical protein